MITIRTDNYPQAKQLINALQAGGIDAAITESGVFLKISPDQVTTAHQIAQRFNLKLQGGNPVVSDPVAQDPDLAASQVKAQGNGHAILQEWLT